MKSSIMKTQVVVVHGGDPFDTYEEYLEYLKKFEVNLEWVRQKKWKGSLQKDLGDDFDVIAPQMPGGFSVKYSEWKLWFEKYVPLLEDEVILLGHSVGGLFLAKYLTENEFSKKILGLFLVAPPYDAEASGESLADFVLEGDVGKLAELTDNIYIYQSRDDGIVPFADFEKYEKDLPGAHAEVFEDKGHFTGEDFPEVVRDIKEVSKKSRAP